MLKPDCNINIVQGIFQNTKKNYFSEHPEADAQTCSTKRLLFFRLRCGSAPVNFANFFRATFLRNT